MAEVRPDSEAALADAIRAANGPLRLVGGGTRLADPPEGTALHLTGLTGITLYEPGALTLVARAGTPLAEIETALAAENQRLAFEPMDHRTLLGTGGEPTIGGTVATNTSGPRRISVGAARDFLLGVRLVDGSGRIVSNGGRVMKNVTGYDLVKLMAGSHGTLGALTEVSLKVLPRPETTATLAIPGQSVAQAVDTLSRALGSPFEVTGAAHHAGETLIRIEGFEASVAYRAERLRELLPGAETADRDWTAIRDVTPLSGRKGALWRISVRPSDAPAMIDRLAPADVLLDWGGGLVWLLDDTGRDLRPLMGCPGHATLLRGGAAPRFHPEDPGNAMLSKGLRDVFDPRGLLNPGLMA